MVRYYLSALFEFGIDILVLAAFILCAIYLFKYIWVSATVLRKICLNLSVFFLTTGIIITIADGVFRTIIIQSDNFGFTLSAQAWNKLYWRPVNEHGYRDYSYSYADLRKKKCC